MGNRAIFDCSYIFIIMKTSYRMLKIQKAELWVKQELDMRRFRHNEVYLEVHMMFTKIPHNVYKRCFSAIGMTFICDLKIGLLDTVCL